MKTRLLITFLIVLYLIGCGPEVKRPISEGIFEKMYFVRDVEGTCYSVIGNPLIISHTVVDCTKYEKKLKIDHYKK